MQYFFVSAVSQTFLSSHSLLLLGGKVVVFLRWRSEKVILKLVPPLVFWHCTKRFPMFPGIFLPCQIKYTNSTSLLCSAALLTKKEKPSAERESVVFAFWKSRNGISTSFPTINTSTSYLLLLQRCSMSVVAFCRCYLPFI